MSLSQSVVDPSDELDRRSAEFEAQYAGRDIQIETYGRPGGAGRLWMTQEQLKRAALRLCMKTRLSGGDHAGGRSDPGADAALVADAYLKEVNQNQDAMDIIRRASKLLQEVPCTPEDAVHLKAADEVVANVNAATYSMPGIAHAMPALLAGYKVARNQMGRLQPERPAVDLTKLRMHPSIQLASGVYFDFLEPDKTPLSVSDIAAGLSRVCRYTGQLAIDEDDIYSVAQHCVLASENCDDDCDPFEALLHDRAESVMNDMASPLKQLLLDYKEIEDRVETSTASYYGVPHPMTDPCKRIDLRMLATEKRDLMPGDMADDKWALIKDLVPLPFAIEPWRPSESRHRFLHRYYFLTEGKLPQPGDRYSRPHPNAPQAWVDALAEAWGADPFKAGSGATGMHPDLRARLEKVS